MTKQEVFEKIASEKDRLGLYIPEFLVSFRTSQRAIIRKHIQDLIIEKKVSYDRTSAIFLYHPVKKTMWRNCKKGGKTEKRLENLYCVVQDSFVAFVYVHS